MKRVWTMVPVLALAAAGCDRGGEGGALVARAADSEFTVNEAVLLLGPEAQLPNQPEVALALADLWIDYSLLATAAAEDTTLQNVDLEPLLVQQAELEMIGALRDSVIQVDTAISEEEVLRRFAQEGPGARVRARHILLAPPDQPTQEQRDSLRTLAEDLLRRLQAGESFEALATQYSQDPASAVQGGDLGFFERGQMVASFDSAAFSLQAGETSGIVTTPYGLHIIRVEEKETPGFDQLGAQFRQQMQGELVMKAESAYVAGVEERAAPELQEGAAEVVREVSRNPLARLAGRAARRELVTWEGGALTVAELRQFMQTRQPQYRQQVESATDEQIVDNVLMALAQREMLIAEARAAGIAPDEARQDSLAEQVRLNFREAARELGLLTIEPAAGESEEDARERVVQELLRSIIRGERDVIPLGAISFTLRQQYAAEVFDSAVDRVVEQVAQVRGPGGDLPGMPPGDMPMPMPEPQPGTGTPDTAATPPAGGA